VSYAHKIDKAEGRIDWQQPAAQIERRIRAFDPQPGCHFEHEGALLKVLRAKVSASFDAGPGTVRIGEAGMTVACGDGSLDLLELQRPGGRRLGVQAFLASHRAR
jgi:methionyl-tRNA formyltransferase